MKKFISISLSIFFLFIGVLLTSCGKNDNSQTSIYKSDNISADLKLTKATGKSLTFDITINDTKEEITKNSVQVIVYNDEYVQKGSKVANLTKEEGSTIYTESGLRIENLNPNREYICRIECTIAESSAILFSQTFSTNDKGMDAENPIVVNTREDLLDITKAPDAYYQLGQDIDLANVEFDPLFKSTQVTSNMFTGSFDGNGHKIKNLKQAGALQDYGLFGYLSTGAKVSNLTIEGLTIETTRYSDTYAGAIAGRAEIDSEISQVNVTGASVSIINSATNKTFYIGGLVGENKGCDIINSSFSGLINVTPSKGIYVGGICGILDSAKITNTYATVDLKVTQKSTTKTSLTEEEELFQFVGGFVGLVNGSAYIKSCAVKGSISSVFETAYNTQEELDKINTDHNVIIGGFVGCSYGYISDISASTNISFESLDAYVVNCGLLAGMLRGKDAVLEKAYYNGANKNITVKLSEDDGLTVPEAGLPTFTRIFNIGVVGRMTSDSIVHSYAVVAPTASISTLVTSYSFEGTLSSTDGISQGVLEFVA